MAGERLLDVVVVGGGQAGLAAGYFLRRASMSFVILDAQAQPGGAWQHGWDSLRLFSPAGHSPLPGWWMPTQEGEDYPSADHVASYLRRYEHRYELPVHRPVKVLGVRGAGQLLAVDTDDGTWHAGYVISATGTWTEPYVPRCSGQEDFAGEQLHASDYRAPGHFRGQRVVVVGGGNSAAQILAEVSEVADTLWVTKQTPRFMPDDVDGRVLFDVATQKEAARLAGRDGAGVSELGDIVMVRSVLAARERGVLHALPMFDSLTREGVAWSDGTRTGCDAIIWCTGFRPALQHLDGLDLSQRDGVPSTEGTRSVDEPRLHLVGYGDWTGFASATVIGAGRAAKAAVADILNDQG